MRERLQNVSVTHSFIFCNEAKQNFEFRRCLFMLPQNMNEVLFANGKSEDKPTKVIASIPGCRSESYTVWSVFVPSSKIKGKN